MKYFWSKKSYSMMYSEITVKEIARQLKEHANLKVDDEITVEYGGVHYKLRLKEIKDNELYFIIINS